MAKMGRPTLYTPEMAERICEIVAKGFPVHRFDERKDVPSSTTVFRWLDEKEDFRERYARAREQLADRFAEQVITISDEADPTTMKGIEHARTRIDARKWAAGKLAPKKYGEWKRTEVTGADGGAIQLETHVSAEQAAAVLQEGLRALGKTEDA